MWVTFAYRTRERILRAVANTMDRERPGYYAILIRDLLPSTDAHHKLSAFIVSFDFGHQLLLTHVTNPRSFVLRDIICLFKYSLLSISTYQISLIETYFFLKLFFHYSLWLCYTYEISFYQKLISLSTAFALAVSLYTNKVISYQILVLSFISKS